MIEEAQVGRAELAEVKRFLELYIADPKVREQARHSPSPLAERVRTLWDSEATGPDGALELAYRELLQARQQRRVQAREKSAPGPAAFRAWRERQILRANSELGRTVAQALVHHPVAFELSLGCSVGCSFCAVSAGRLTGVYDYHQNQQAWDECVKGVIETLGSAAGQSVCYWATDPFDNPGYEDFLLDFHRLTGHAPPTTTALADRDLDRTRSFLELSQQRGGTVRFSVLSLAQLRRLHQAFSPEELFGVELVLQNRGALTPRASAGRAFKEGEEGSTIACVSGFLVNLVEGSVELISPCAAQARWPQGYRVHGRASFGSASQLPSALEQLMRPETMPLRLPLERPVQLRQDLRWDGRALQSRHATHQVDSPELIEALGSEPVTPVALAQRFLSESTLEQTLYRLNRLYQQGVLDDDIPAF